MLRAFTDPMWLDVPDQWMLEVENWFAGVLVMLETFTKSYVTGMPDVKYFLPRLRRFEAPLTLCDRPDLYSAPAKDEEWMWYVIFLMKTLVCGSDMCADIRPIAFQSKSSDSKH